MKEKSINKIGLSSSCVEVASTTHTQGDSKSSNPGVSVGQAEPTPPHIPGREIKQI